MCLKETTHTTRITLYTDRKGLAGICDDEKRKSNLFKFGAGAQFIVSKKQILKRPKEFYLKIIEMLEKEKDPIEGYIIERFHPLIFS